MSAQAPAPAKAPKSPFLLLLSVGLTLALVVAAVIVGVSLTGGHDARTGAAPDAGGACRGSNVALDTAARRFGLKLPGDAKDVHYLAHSGGLSGEYDLEMRFRTSAAGLQHFLTGSGLPGLGGNVDILRTGQPEADPCRQDSEGLPHARYAGDQVAGDAAHGAYVRGVAVDDSDRARPVVALIAMDT
ncbi:hypothetical protein ABZ883_10550 [Streptomyces sp. NPDC046977]|uniref:hypothetical protein n=1 Tax=Streptomyces sp. NPDC046977 TaxID=3154703 RepID=UPI0033C68B7D